MSRPRGWLTARLPMGMREDDVLVRFVSMLEVISESVQQSIDQLPHLADPAVAPTPTLEWLARMVGSRDLENLSETQRRSWVNDAGQLMLRRGTRAQIEALVAPFADGAFTVIDDGGIFPAGGAPACHGTVWVSIERLAHSTPEEVGRLVREAVPAHCTVWMKIGDSDREMVMR